MLFFSHFLSCFLKRDLLGVFSIIYLCPVPPVEPDIEQLSSAKCFWSQGKVPAAVMGSYWDISYQPKWWTDRLLDQQRKVANTVKTNTIKENYIKQVDTSFGLVLFDFFRASFLAQTHEATLYCSEEIAPKALCTKCLHQQPIARYNGTHRPLHYLKTSL